MDNRFSSYPKSNVIIALVGVLSLTTVLALSPPSDTKARVDLPVTLSVPQPVAETEPVSLTPAPLAAVSTGENWTVVDVREGDNLSLIFQRMGLTAGELQRVMALGHEVDQLRKIIPGQQIKLEITDTGKLNRLAYSANPVENLVVSRTGSAFQADHQVFQPELFTNLRQGIITSDNPSLYHAAQEAGLSDAMIMELSYIFQWDISFALDLRVGDHFTVLYEEKYLRGEKIGDGDILAASFTNMGTTHQAVLYRTAGGEKSYYTPTGENMRKAFIRDPIHFTRVSSNFNLRRLHPIHKRVMPHRGIDYVANRGTPVKASGDGVVSIARQNSASGKYIVIQHGEQYETKYLHLDGFARGIRTGKRVRQGDIIGYVGSTGWATAPHLHYEFLVNGVHRNPRTVTLPDAEPIDINERERFVAQVSPYLVHLQNVARVLPMSLAGE